MNIPKEKLKLIGISIKVNRKAKLKETKAGKWNQMNFAEGICSQNTLIKIEHGQVSRFIEVYEEAAEKLNRKLGYFPDIDKQIEKITLKLYQAVEFYDIKKINLLTKKLLECLEPVKEYLWYCDLSFIAGMIRKYYIKIENLTKIEIYMLLDILDELSDKLVKIIKFLIFNSAYYDIENSDYDELFKTLDIENCDYICNKINLLLYYYAHNYTSDFLDLARLLEQECLKENNYFRLLDVYNLTLTYSSCYDSKKIDMYAEKIMKVLKMVNLPKSKLVECFYSIGLAFYENQYYEKAIEYFQKCYDCDDHKVKMVFALIAVSQRKLELEIHIPYYSDDDLKKFPEDSKYIYKYFSMDNDIPPFIKQKFIMEEILPRLHDHDELIINLMKDELNSLVLKTSHYKDVSIFDIKARQLLGK